jgi:hypothetical protein
VSVWHRYLVNFNQFVRHSLVHFWAVRDLALAGTWVLWSFLLVLYSLRSLAFLILGLLLLRTFLNMYLPILLTTLFLLRKNVQHAKL